jgi:hypothetical protein
LGFGVRGLGFGVWGSRFGVWGSRFGVWGSRFGVRGSGEVLVLVLLDSAAGVFAVRRLPFAVRSAFGAVRT